MIRNLLDFANNNPLICEQHCIDLSLTSCSGRRSARQWRIDLSPTSIVKIITVNSKTKINRCIVTQQKIVLLPAQSDTNDATKYAIQSIAIERLQMRYNRSSLSLQQCKHLTTTPNSFEKKKKQSEKKKTITNAHESVHAILEYRQVAVCRCRLNCHHQQARKQSHLRHHPYAKH